jgi:hypothetical protein
VAHVQLNEIVAHLQLNEMLTFSGPRHDHARFNTVAQLSTQANPAVVMQALGRVQSEVGGEITPAAIRTLGYERLKRLVERVHRNKQKASRIVDAATTLEKQHGDVVPRSSKVLQRDFLGIGAQLGELLESIYAGGWAAHVPRAKATHTQLRTSVDGSATGVHTQLRTSVDGSATGVHTQLRTSVDGSATGVHTQLRTSVDGSATGVHTQQAHEPTSVEASALAAALSIAQETESKHSTRNDRDADAPRHDDISAGAKSERVPTVFASTLSNAGEPNTASDTRLSPDAVESVGPTPVTGHMTIKQTNKPKLNKQIDDSIRFNPTRLTGPVKDPANGLTGPVNAIHLVNSNGPTRLTDDPTMATKMAKSLHGNGRQSLHDADADDDDDDDDFVSAAPLLQKRDSGTQRTPKGHEQTSHNAARGNKKAHKHRAPPAQRRAAKPQLDTNALPVEIEGDSHAPRWVECPVCERSIGAVFINQHLDTHM